MQEYLEKRFAGIRRQSIADQEEVLGFLTQVMRRELSDHVVVSTAHSVAEYVPDEKGTMRKRTVTDKGAQVVRLPVRIADASRAAALLGRMYGTLTEEEAETPLHITVDYGEDE